MIYTQKHRADYRKWITSAPWLRLRAATLKRHPLCERCQIDGRETPATEVHHRHPVEDGITTSERRALMFDPLNLVALCHDCHIAVHLELGRGGKKGALRRTDAERRKFDSLLGLNV